MTHSRTADEESHQLTNIGEVLQHRALHGELVQVGVEQGKDPLRNRRRGILTHVEVLKERRRISCPLDGSIEVKMKGILARRSCGILCPHGCSRERSAKKLETHTPSTFPGGAGYKRRFEENRAGAVCAVCTVM